MCVKADLGDVITSGGGFSTHYERPAYQNAAVSTYLASTQGLAAAAGYNPNGRAYPDISFLAVQYPIICNGITTRLWGTSASAPFAAALSKCDT